MGPHEDYVDYDSEELAAADIWMETGGEGMQVWESVLPSMETGQMSNVGASFESVFIHDSEENEGFLNLSEVQGIGSSEAPLKEVGQEFSPGDFSLLRDSPVEETRGNESNRRPEPPLISPASEEDDSIQNTGPVEIGEGRPSQSHLGIEDSANEKGTRRPRRKCIKNKGLLRNLSLGEDVEMQEVVEMSKVTLVGRVNGRSFALGTIQNWVKEEWGLLGYTPVADELSRKWFAFTFRSEDQAQEVLRKNWSIQSFPLLLKPWTPMFDASRERVDTIPIWVRLPAFPFQFWKEKFFRKIGNMLGEFLEADESFKDSNQKRMARILVNINVREGLGDAVELVLGHYRHIQKLDYENIPFRCRRCHEYGHLVGDCKLPLRIIKRKNPKEAVKRSTRNETLQVEPAPDPMREAGVGASSEPRAIQEAGPLVIKKGRPSRGGSSVRWTHPSLPMVFPTGIPPSPSFALSSLLQNLNLNFVSNRWIEPINASLPVSDPPFRKPLELEDSPQDGPPPPEDVIVEKPLKICEGLKGTSGSSRYFLRSKTTPNPAGGLGLEGQEGGRGRGRKSFMAKAKNKAKIDLKAGKQQSIEWALRAARAQDMGS